MAFTQPEILEVKTALTEMKASFLPVIPGRDKTLSFSGSFCKDYPVRKTVDETVEGITDIPLRHPKVRPYLRSFIKRAFLIAEDGMSLRLSGYCGLVGAEGQLLDYLHSDERGIVFRETITIADRTCPINPSTEIAPYATRACGAWNELAARYGQDYEEVPKSLFLPQVDEGQPVAFSHGQYHAERTLPAGTAKLALMATYN
jgi:hypothetical protein